MQKIAGKDTAIQADQTLPCKCCIFTIKKRKSVHYLELK